MLWTIQHALNLIRSMQADCMANGYYIALAGGVLNKGESKNDLDLVAVPRTCDSDPKKLVEALCRASIYIERADYTEQHFTHWTAHHLALNQRWQIEISIPARGVPETYVDPCKFVYD